MSLADIRRDTDTLAAMLRYHAEHGRLPSWEELGERLGIDRTSAFRRVRTMAAKTSSFTPQTLHRLAQVSEETGLQLDFVHAYAVHALRARAGICETLHAPPPPSELPEPTSMTAEPEPEPRKPSIPPPNEFTPKTAAAPTLYDSAWRAHQTGGGVRQYPSASEA
jgi:hypothetical protein